VSLYLGLDASTQSLTAILIEAAGEASTRVVFETSLQFDTALPRYGTRHGVLPSIDARLAVSSPLLWADALDEIMGRVAASGIDLTQIAAIAGSAQQHGSVYLNARARSTLPALDPRRAPGEQLAACLSRPVAPIWMDATTSRECAEITAALGGSAAVAARTGSRAFERFTGPQIRKFYKTDPDAYGDTDRIHLVSSFLASLLAGRGAPIDPGDGSGMNLMDLSARGWWAAALEATAPMLAGRLPPIASSSTVVGPLSEYWRARHGFPAARIVVWSGDNPCSLVGTGLVREGLVGISLGTSDTIFGLMREPRVSADGSGHVFGSPTGDYMALTCFANGSLARERVRDAFGLTWRGFSDALAVTQPGNDGRMLLPWFGPEITPPVFEAGVRRFDLAEDDAAGNVRAIVEAQMMAMALHARWMNVVIDRIHATGGASTNREILQVMSDVFGADVYQFRVGNSACLGAALRARHADLAADGRQAAWSEVVKDIAAPIEGSRVTPDPARHAVYRGFIDVYAAREAEALACSPTPTRSDGR
jgi:xylulokinase